jgi:hypothetical protein
MASPLSRHPTDGGAPSASALRMARHRRRKERRMRWIGIELREAEINVLVRRGWLSNGDRAESRRGTKGPVRLPRWLSAVTRNGGEERE